MSETPQSLKFEQLEGKDTLNDRENDNPNLKEENVSYLSF